MGLLNLGSPRLIRIRCRPYSLRGISCSSIDNCGRRNRWLTICDVSLWHHCWLLSQCCACCHDISIFPFVYGLKKPFTSTCRIYFGTRLPCNGKKKHLYSFCGNFDRFVRFANDLLYHIWWLSCLYHLIVVLRLWRGKLDDKSHSIHLCSWLMLDTDYYKKRIGRNENNFNNSFCFPLAFCFDLHYSAGHGTKWKSWQRL